jgi:hypothetical protein
LDDFLVQAQRTVARHRRQDTVYEASFSLAAGDATGRDLGRSKGGEVEPITRDGQLSPVRVVILNALIGRKQGVQFVYLSLMTVGALTHGDEVCVLSRG